MDKNRQIDIMGIVNLTDDSYFSPSRCADTDQALSLARRMIKEGAGIIDFGAGSSRPGAEPSDPETEWRRLQPVLAAVRDAFPDIRVSIDTTWASVVSRACGLIGSFIVNDISAGEDDPRMLETVGTLGLPYVAMHKRGTPQTMQSLTDYDDVTSDVLEYFRAFSRKADACGIEEWIIDPGFGFAKTAGQNYELIRGLNSFREEFPSNKILVGVSRKSMIYRFLDITPEESLPATQVLHLAALQNGADILRVHDVAEAARTISLYRMLA